MSKRFNLREFQQQVLDRLQAQATGDARVSSLGVRVGDTFWLVDMPDISEVLPVPHLTQVPLTKAWYCGVANVRGSLYSVVDLGAYMDDQAIQREANNRVLLLGQGFAFNTGLLVSKVLGLRNTQDWQEQEINGEMRLQDANGQVWRKLDITQMLSQPEFLQIGV
ncbi:MAG: chemotaxis protein CheW [Sideroxydans sp.]|jgi:twitching motility protein PilI